jgi:hypothetical protein
MWVVSALTGGSHTDVDPAPVTCPATSTPPCPEFFTPVSTERATDSIIAPATAKVSPLALRQVKDENSTWIYLLHQGCRNILKQPLEEGTFGGTFNVAQAQQPHH